jgi:WXG100 family type VII secretion target
MSIDVTPTELHDTAKQVRQGSADVQQVLASLATKVQNLTWRGSGSEGFQLMFEDWKRGAAQVNEAMEGIASLLGQAADAYDRTDQDIRANTGH